MSPVEFGFPLHISLIPIAIPAAVLLLGLFLFVRVNKLLGSLIGAFGVLFGLLFGPMLLMDRVTVDDRRIHQSTGFWFDQTEKGFSFDGIERVTITTGRDLKGRVIEVWIAEYKDRPSVTVDPGSARDANPELLGNHIYLTAVLSRSGRQDDAEWQAMEVLTLNPDFSVERWTITQAYKDPAERDRLREDLLRAGLPE